MFNKHSSNFFKPFRNSSELSMAALKIVATPIITVLASAFFACCAIVALLKAAVELCRLQFGNAISEVGNTLLLGLAATAGMIIGAVLTVVHCAGLLVGIASTLSNFASSCFENPKETSPSGEAPFADDGESSIGAAEVTGDSDTITIALA